MKFLLWILLLFALPAFAASDEDPAIELLGHSYYYYFFRPTLQTVSVMPTRCTGCAAQDPLEIPENPQCMAFYGPLERSGELRIHVSFGYFDESEGEPYVFNGTDFGMNASLDHAFYLAFTEGLTTPCENEAGACGFTEKSSGHFTKTIRRPGGTPVHVELVAENASLTPYFQTNTADRAEEQTERSAASRLAFLDALETDDVVFYIGHSRNGGGPDFAPPHLLANHRPNYHGYYQVRKPGYHDMMSAIAERGSAPPLFGVFSCLSEGWFGPALYKASPSTGYILTPPNLLVSMDEVFKASIAALDSILRFQCYEGMANEITAVRSDPNYEVHVRGFLSDRHPVDTHARITAGTSD